jgi:hypothetical protein
LELLQAGLYPLAAIVLELATETSLMKLWHQEGREAIVNISSTELKLLIDKRFKVINCMKLLIYEAL